jgi:drug/metabolite transporter (DMT)-like permease
LPYLLYQKDLGVSKRLLKIFLAFGLIEALALLLEFAPVILGVPVSVSVLLLYTAPLWTVIFSRFIFKEAITVPKIIAVGLVLLGVVFLVNPSSITKEGNMAGILIALVSGIFLSLWTIFGKICGNEKSSPAKTQFYNVFFTLIFLLILQPVMSSFIQNPALINFSFDLPAMVWVYLGLFALISNLIPHLSYYHGIREVPASTAGVILLLEPLAGTLLAALFLAQAITLNVLLGGILILAANYLVIKYEDKSVSPASEPENKI